MRVFIFAVFVLRETLQIIKIDGKVVAAIIDSTEIEFKNITHTIDLMAVAQDATFGLIAGTASTSAGFNNVSVSGKLVFGDSCSALAGSDNFTVKTVIGNGDVTGINVDEITVQKQNDENTSFELIVDEDGVVSIISGS